MEIIHKTTNETIAKNAKLANSMLERMLGLMFKKEMKNMDALILEPCNSIHNMFVRFPLDVIFLSRSNKVVKIIRNFKPWRISGIYLRAYRVVEMPAGKLSSNIAEGDELEVRGV